MKSFKPADKTMYSMVSEFPGRNESKRVGSLDSYKTQWPSPYAMDEGNMSLRNLTETGNDTLAGYERQHGDKDTSRNWRGPPHPGRNIRSKVIPITAKREKGRKVRGSRRGS